MSTISKSASLLLVVLLAGHCLAAVAVPAWAVVAGEVVVLALWMVEMRKGAMRKGEVTVCWPLVALWGVLALSMAVHPRPLTMLRTGRLFALALGLLCFSPLIVNEYVSQMRARLLRRLTGAMSLMVVASAVVWVWAVAHGASRGDVQYYFFGFRGVFGMGMALSPVAMFCAVVAMDAVFTERTLRRRLTAAALTAVGLLMAVAAGSRAALAGGALAVIVLLWMHRKQIFGWFTGRRRPAAFAVAAAMVVVAAVAAPFALQSLRFKLGVAERASHGHFESRWWHWQARINEFRSEPLTGVGFDREDIALTDFPEGLPLAYHPGVRRFDDPRPFPPADCREPGSSWLSVASFAGVPGIAAILWFAVAMGRKLASNGRSANRSFPTVPLLLFFFVDGCAEGWLLYSGAVLFPLFWLTCSEAFRNPA